MRDSGAQLGQATHWGILIRAIDQSSASGLNQFSRLVKIGESLSQIDRSKLPAQGRQSLEYGCARWGAALCLWPAHGANMGLADSLWQEGEMTATLHRHR